MMVAAGSWVDTPLDDIILGLKELPEGDSESSIISRRVLTSLGPLTKKFIHFQHVFKKQVGWAATLSRFAKGNGLLYDLEFLVGEDGRRVAAFGYWAGYAGTGIAFMSFTHQLLHPGVAQGPVPVFRICPGARAKRQVTTLATLPPDQRTPRIIVIGALGRCGKGAIDFCHAVEHPRREHPQVGPGRDARRRPVRQVAESDIFVSCVYLGAHRIPPLRHVRLPLRAGPPAAHHLRRQLRPQQRGEPDPHLLELQLLHQPDGADIAQAGRDRARGAAPRSPRRRHRPPADADRAREEASGEFSGLLLPSLLTLDHARETEGVWTRAEKTYKGEGSASCHRRSIGTNKAKSRVPAADLRNYRPRGFHVCN